MRLLLLLFLVSCHLGITQTPRNSKCFKDSRLLITQVLHRGLLGYICSVDSGTIGCFADGFLVFMPTEGDNDYVDYQKLDLEDEKCFVADGVYTYYTVQNVRKRIRKVKIINSRAQTLGDVIKHGEN